jgi:hypothetical protein
LCYNFMSVKINHTEVITTQIHLGVSVEYRILIPLSRSMVIYVLSKSCEIGTISTWSKWTHS